MGIDDLDIVLEYLYCNRRYQYIAEIHAKVNKIKEIPIIDVLVVLNKLAKDENITVEEHETTTKETITSEAKHVSSRDAYFISFEGILFFEQSPFMFQKRPYKWKQIKQTLNVIWTIAKIVITALNALAILYLMWKAIPM